MFHALFLISKIKKCLTIHESGDIAEKKTFKELEDIARKSFRKKYFITQNGITVEKRCFPLVGNSHLQIELINRLEKEFPNFMIQLAIYVY